MIRHFFCLILLAFTLAALSAQGASNTFAAGTAAWQAGRFDEAARCFKQELQHRPSSEAWHNYGNAAWQAGHPGEAVLAWERARWIAPGNTNAAASLRFVDNLGQFSELPLTWTEKYSAWLPAGQWAWLAAGSGWLAVSLAVLPGIFRRRKSAWQSWLAATALGLLLLTLPALAGIHSRAKLAVILPANTPLRQTPTLTAQPLARLAAGEMVRCLRLRGAYWFVRTANDETGWIAQNQLGFVAADQLPAWP
jgi:tetratricopeptide (TPR) repeat protein